MIDADKNNESADIVSADSKIQILQKVADGSVVDVDTAALKSRLALFLMAHANKVMDTVAPLETMRSELANAFIERAQQSIDDPEVRANQIYTMIDAIQQMNAYSLNSIKSILDADKLNTIIAIDASDKSTKVQTNVLNLDSAQSRARVTKAVDAINKILQNQQEQEVSDINDKENSQI